MVGWLIGLFGVGGGFVIVPVLVLGLRLSMTEAVATSLLVVIIGSSFALLQRLSARRCRLGDRAAALARGALGALAGRGSRSG